jgi:hypothetical protein
MTQLVLDVEGGVDVADMGLFKQIPFAVPADATRLRATLDFVREDRLFLHLQLFDAEGRFRGRGFSYNGQGAIQIELEVRSEGGPPRGIPGPLGPGQWIAEVEVRTVERPSPFRLRVAADTQSQSGLERMPGAEVAAAPASTTHTSERAAGWMRGDLHAHTTESDGSLALPAAVAIARERGLDFLAFAEHNTSSGWRHYPALTGPDLVLIRAEEMTTGLGHGVALGLREWLDWRVGRIDGHGARTVNDVLRDVREQGGIFYPAHPFIPNFDWRFTDTDWSLVDALEVWSNPPYAGSPGATMRAFGLWDALLREGYRILGLGGSDAHRLENPWQSVGIPFTYVHTTERSEAAIVEAIRRGRVYVTLGAEMELVATAVDAPGQQAFMGDVLSASGPITLTLEVRRFHGPLRARLVRDGLVLQRINRPAQLDGCHTIEFRDLVDRPAFYRVELHQDRGRESEDTGTLQAFGNPIFVRPPA